ncbi:unnamed protein product [Pieris macdunnoughi]|uniref:Defensin n=1 Tax=Pieris macdunnoughi TaxID=345717 RepID=A0A821UU09_9NEOP|nr:unnamed protein product [Pieris macdunnoughi]
MKYFAIFALVFLAFAAFVQSAPADVEVPSDGVSEAIELWSSSSARAGESRRRVCTAQLCRAVCSSLGYRWSRCNAQRYCICSR